MCYSEVHEECQAFVLCCLGMLVITALSRLHYMFLHQLTCTLSCLYIPPMGSSFRMGDPTQTGKSFFRPGCWAKSLDYAGNNLKATNCSYAGCAASMIIDKVFPGVIRF